MITGDGEALPDSMWGVCRFHRELEEHESRSAAEVEALKRSNAAADDGLGRHVEATVARQAQLRGDIRAKQDTLRSNDATISRLQSEASFPLVMHGPLRGAPVAIASCLWSEPGALPRWGGSLKFSQAVALVVTHCTRRTT